MPTQRRRPTPRAEARRPAAPEGPEGERLQRVLARAGFGSRRAAEELIRQGRVEVNGGVAELGRRVRVDRDSVTVDGAPIPADPALRYYAFNKPAGVTTTLSDPHAAESLVAYLPRGPRVVPVGRLDRDSEGLLLLTNDGELGFRLQHPRFGVEKEYLAEVTGDVSREALRALRQGVELDDGVARVLRARVEGRAHGRSSDACACQRRPVQGSTARGWARGRAACCRCTPAVQSELEEAVPLALALGLAVGRAFCPYEYAPAFATGGQSQGHQGPCT